MKVQNAAATNGNSHVASSQLPASSASTKAFLRISRQKQRYQSRLQQQLATLERRLTDKHLLDHLVLLDDKQTAALTAPQPTVNRLQLGPSQELQLRSFYKLKEMLASTQDSDLTEAAAG